MRGWRIARGEVWHDPAQRRSMLMLVVLGFVPMAGLMLQGGHWITPSSFFNWVLWPSLAAIGAAAAFMHRRHPRLVQRLGVGLLSGWLAAMACDMLQLLALSQGLTGTPHPVWPGLIVSAGLPGSLIAGYTCHWIATGALWGMAYGLLWGKTRWTFGPLFACALWGVSGFFALVLPGPLIPHVTPGALFAMLISLVAYGVVLGALNEALQPEPIGKGKIIFLRDYQARVKQRK